MGSTLAVWKQYNKMAVLHFFLVNFTLIYILFLSNNFLYLYMFCSAARLESIFSDVKSSFQDRVDDFEIFLLFFFVLMLKPHVGGKLILKNQSSLKSTALYEVAQIYNR